MELDDLKLAWQSLDRRLEQQNRLALHQLKEAKASKARSGLRPLYWAHVAQGVLGVLVILFAVSVWTTHRATGHVLAAGLVVQAYGVLMIVFSVRTLSLINRLDYAAPVITIQRQLAELRRFYVLGGLTIGMPWWLLWVPFMMLGFMGLFGADVYERAPSVIYIGLSIGVAGLLATWWLHRLAQHPSRPRLARFLDDAMTGRSLRRAQKVLEEIKQFEQE